MNQQTCATETGCHFVQFVFTVFCTHSGYASTEMLDSDVTDLSSIVCLQVKHLHMLSLTFVEHLVSFVQNQHLDGPCPQTPATNHICRKTTDKPASASNKLPESQAEQSAVRAETVYRVSLGNWNVDFHETGLAVSSIQYWVSLF